ncbi:MAG: AAA family ATPase [Brachybacterium tyrofermentans]|uniref:AAA family ATPase n=1 Tax=Brachybacterium tyrofermentans TaxID=47848 RepID=UPI0018682834|nr:AAA family ATPase [Brachybacterium tyrofermentans]
MTSADSSPAALPGLSALDGGRAILLVTGPPAAGKSTVTRMLAGTLNRSALLDGDFVARLVVSGYVWPLGEPAEEARRQVALCNRNLCDLARNMVGAGITPVIDWIVPDREQFDVFSSALGDLGLRTVVLAPDPAACVERNLQRDERARFDFDDHAGLLARMGEAFGDDALWVGSSRLSAEETVDLIVEELGGQVTVARLEDCPAEVPRH